MRARLAASVVLAGALMLGTSGCAFFSEQATLIHYDPSDGIGASVGHLQVRNALVLTKDGETGSFLVNFINDGTSTIDFTVQYKNSADKTVVTDITLKAGQTKSYGGSEDKQLQFYKMGTKAGNLFPVWVQYGSHTGAEMPVPVLDGTWQTYKGLLPTATPTPTPTATATTNPVVPVIPTSPTPTPTATP